MEYPIYPAKNINNSKLSFYNNLSGSVVQTRVEVYRFCIATGLFLYQKYDDIAPHKIS